MRPKSQNYALCASCSRRRRQVRRTVAAVEKDALTFVDGGRIETSTVIWAAVVQAAPLAGALGAKQWRQDV